jgi:predicted RNase H-like HicB family nuclease
MRYAVIFEKSATSFGAYVPDLPGCMAVGESLAEARSLIAAAMKQHLAELKQRGNRVPDPASVAAYIDV